jgi:hypothetical protein
MSFDRSHPTPTRARFGSGFLPVWISHREDARLLPEEVIVERRDIEPVLQERGHHRIEPVRRHVNILNPELANSFDEDGQWLVSRRANGFSTASTAGTATATARATSVGFDGVIVSASSREASCYLDSILGQAYSVSATELGAQRNRRSFALPSRRWSLVPRDGCGTLETGQVGPFVNHRRPMAPSQWRTMTDVARRPDHQWRTRIHELAKVLAM